MNKTYDFSTEFHKQVYMYMYIHVTYDFGAVH